MTYRLSTYRGWTIRHEQMGHVNIITPDGQWAGGHSTEADAHRRVDVLIERAATVVVNVPYKGKVAAMLARRAPAADGPMHGPRADRATDSLSRTVYVVGEQPHAVYPETDALLIMRGAFRGKHYPTAARVGPAILWPMRGVRLERA